MSKLTQLMLDQPASLSFVPTSPKTAKSNTMSPRTEQAHKSASAENLHNEAESSLSPVTVSQSAPSSPEPSRA